MPKKVLNSVNQSKHWQQQLRDSVTQLEPLLARLQITAALTPAQFQAMRDFPLRVPEAFIQRMQIADSADPLLKQILPSVDELIAAPGFSLDPLQEQAKNPIPGLLHKYHGRVLILLTAACAINCRYCFRRNFNYQNNQPDFEKIQAYIANDPTIEEIIFSGGDPLVLKDQQLLKISLNLQKIPHVKRLRFHTRLPIVIPDRINDDFIDYLNQVNVQKIMVLHCNHANEIDAAVMQAVQKLKQAHVVLYNQAVLLKAVNDNLKAQVDLHKKLFEIGVQPYYLHVLDKTHGTAHFYVDDLEAKTLYQAMQALLPGFMLPKLVREVANEKFKVIL